MKFRRSAFVILATAALAAPWLSGCTMSDDKLARVLVAPGKYATYRCAEIAEQAKAISPRENELKALMARSGAGPGGELVNALAYRTEYLSLHGQMMDLRQAARDKHCDFVPGESNPVGTPSAGTTELPPPPAIHPLAPAR